VPAGAIVGTRPFPFDKSEKFSPVFQASARKDAFIEQDVDEA
jgi:hypothetical protein